MSAPQRLQRLRQSPPIRRALEIERRCPANLQTM
jgi:hypothetical protein